MSEAYKEFESAVPSRGAFPDDIEQWPESDRSAVFAARDRLMKAHPDRRVVGEIAYCIDRSNDRFPENVPDHWSHMLVFQIALDELIDMAALEQAA